MMYNPQLDTFLCVVEAGSFSKAAEQLYISAPAVIKQINSLEASLGMKLFDRTHRGLVVTEAGQSIYNDAKYIIGYCKESVQRAKEAMQVSDDVIRVGISPMTPPQVFVDLWPQIQNLYPDMKFKLITFENTLENAREILANLGQNIDVEAFNWCENENEVLLAFKSWESVHPLIKIIPVEWDYTMPFGILHSKTPSDKVKRLIKAIRQIK